VKIAIGSDHAGYEYKQMLIKHMEAKGLEVKDFGTSSTNSCDYPEFCRPVAEEVAAGICDRGIVLGGSGNGEAITANRVAGVRCALCWDEATARLCREHNNAKVISIGQRMVSEDMAKKIVDIWLETAFEGGRHERRIGGIDISELPTEARKAEVRELLELSTEKVKELAGEKLVVCKDIDELHRTMARNMADEIKGNNAKKQPTRLIVPVGPTGQYPYLAEIINKEGISLADTWFFYMDEYCGEDGKAITIEHPLSFKREAENLFFKNLETRPAKERVIFPDENNIDSLADMIEKVGGIDVCYGGIGIHGHVAFNEPLVGITKTNPRKVRLNNYTVTINAVRSNVGGNLECFPRFAFTQGMKQILAARKIRLYCRNGCEFDWANTVLRLALLGKCGDDYPVTHIRDKDYVITTDEETLAKAEAFI
jgi:RpiB/LacA/LacB family sugar-phosphate isomerase